jgi:hypothetical protein
MATSIIPRLGLEIRGAALARRLTAPGHPFQRDSARATRPGSPAAAWPGMLPVRVAHGHAEAGPPYAEDVGGRLARAVIALAQPTLVASKLRVEPMGPPNCQWKDGNDRHLNLGCPKIPRASGCDNGMPDTIWTCARTHHTPPRDHGDRALMYYPRWPGRGRPSSLCPGEGAGSEETPGFLQPRLEARPDLQRHLARGRLTHWKDWRTRYDSNVRPLPSEGNALSS